MTTLDLIQRLAAAETTTAQFVAPRVADGLIRASVEGLVSTYRPDPRDFVGWGTFRLRPDRTARLVKSATRPMIKRWLARLRPLRFYLAKRLDDHTWIGWPADEEAFSKVCGAPRPVPIQLVSEGDVFSVVIAREDGGTFWGDRVARRADPRQPAKLRAALRTGQTVEGLRMSGLTPEAKQAYALALGPPPTARTVPSAVPRPAPRVFNDDEVRLRTALRTGGGRLSDYVDRGEYWRVDWVDRDGVAQHSAVAKKDLTIISAGICLDGTDARFDLQSIVGVVQGAHDQW